MLNGPARHNRMAIFALLCGIFCNAQEGFLFAKSGGFFFQLWKEIVKNGVQSQNLSTTWYNFILAGQRGKWYEKTFIIFDFHIIP